MTHNFSVTVGGVTRELPTIGVGEMGRVPLVELIGDVAFTAAVAEALLPLIPGDTEVLLTVVTNSLPLTHVLAERTGLAYEVVRKKRRSYMRDPLIQEVPGLTLGVSETLWLDGRHAARLRGKKVTVVVDVVASGGTLEALVRLIERAGGILVGCVAAFKQGEPRREVAYLQELPKVL